MIQSAKIESERKKTSAGVPRLEYLRLNRKVSWLDKDDNVRVANVKELIEALETLNKIRRLVGLA